jgi:hypothetical protein
VNSPVPVVPTPSVTADPQLRTTGARRRVAAAVVAGMVLLAGVGVLSWRNGYATAVATRPLTDADIAAKCRENYTYTDTHLVGEPVQRFVARDGDEQARVYVSEIDNWMIVCRADAAGVRSGLGTDMEPGPADRLQLFNAEDAVMKANLVVGRVPAGTMTIRARLASGRVVTATHDSEVFVVWAAGASVRGAEVTATRADGSVIAVTTAPAQF